MKTKNNILKDKKDTILFNILLVALIYFVIYILFFYQYLIDSDSSVPVIIANGIIKNGFSYFKNFVNQQTVMPIHILYYLPSLILRFLTNNLSIILKLTIIFNIITLLLSIKFATQTIFEKKSFLISSIIILSGLGSIWFKKFMFYEPYYMIILDITLILIGIYSKYLIKKDYRIRYLIIIAFIIIIFGSTDMRLFLYFSAPILVSTILYFILDNFFAKKETIFLRVKPFFVSIVVILVSTIMGLKIFSLLGSKMYMVNRLASSSAFVFDKPSKLADNFIYYISCLPSLFGFSDAIGGVPTISLKSIIYLLSVIITTLIIFIFPILLCRKYKLLTSEIKFILLYYFSSISIITYITCFSTFCSEAKVSGSSSIVRFLIPIVVIGIIISSYYINEYVLKSNSVMYSVIIIAILFVYILISYFMLPYEAIKAKESYINKMKVNKYLIDNGYNYGFASFWNSDVNTLLSNGELSVNPMYFETMSPFYDLHSIDNYKSDSHEGSTFLIMDQQEYEKNNILEQYIGKNHKVVDVAGYKLLLFSKNFVQYMPMFPLSVLEEKNILNAVNGNELIQKNVDDSINIKHGGIMNIGFNYFKEGKYLAKIDVNYEESANKAFNLMIIDNFGIKQNYPLSNGTNLIEFNVSHLSTNLRIYLSNEKGINDIKINKLSIKREE